MPVMRKFLVFFLLVILSSSCFADQVFTLDKAIGSALRNNDQVIIAQKKMEASQAKVSQAFSGYLPSVSASLRT
jgi:outer membrane protein TolC